MIIIKIMMSSESVLEAMNDGVFAQNMDADCAEQFNRFTDCNYSGKNKKLSCSLKKIYVKRQRMNEKPIQWFNSLSTRHFHVKTESDVNVRAKNSAVLSHEFVTRIDSEPGAYLPLVKSRLKDWCLTFGEITNEAHGSLSALYKLLGESSDFAPWLIREAPAVAFSIAEQLFENDEADVTPISMVLLNAQDYTTTQGLMNLIRDTRRRSDARLRALLLVSLLRPSHFLKHSQSILSTGDAVSEDWPSDDELKEVALALGQERFAAIIPELDYGPSIDHSQQCGVNRLFDAALLQPDSPYRLYGPLDDEFADTGTARYADYILVNETNARIESPEKSGTIVDATPVYEIPSDGDGLRIANLLDLFARACLNADRTGRFGAGRGLPSVVGQDGNIFYADFGRSTKEMKGKNDLGGADDEPS